MKEKLKTVYQAKADFLPSQSWKSVITSGWMIPFTLTLILCVILSLRLITDSDLGFHLHGGKWISENLKFPEKDTYTYTVNQNDYIDLHWAYQLVLYGTYLIGNYESLTLLNSVFLITVILLLFSLFLKTGVPVSWSVITLILCIFGLEIRFGVRPEVVSWILLLSVIFILEDYFHQRKNRLYLLPVIMMIWVNVQGIFIIGLIAVGSYFLSRWLHTKTPDKNLLKWGLISAGSVFLNPYFLKGVLFPFYLFTRLKSDSVFHDAVSEFVSPWVLGHVQQNPFFPVISIYIFYGFSIAGSLLVLLSIRKRKLHELLMFGAFLYVASLSMRNMPLFHLVAAPIILKSAYGLFSRVSFSKMKSGFNPIFFPILISVFLILISLRVMTGFYYADDRRSTQFGIGLAKESHPVSAAEFIKKNHLVSGRILNDLNTGSWLGWDLNQPVFIDGRLEVMQENFFSLFSESYKRNGIHKLIQIYHPDLVVLDPVTSLQWSFDLKKNPDWRLIHVDENAVIFMRKNFSDSVPEFSPESAFENMTETASVTLSDAFFNRTTVPVPAINPFQYWLSGFYTKIQYHPFLQNTGIYFYQHQDFETAEKYYLAFIAETGGNMKDIYFNLGSLYYRWNQPEKMKICYEVYLTYRESEIARQRIGEIGK